MTTIAFKDGVLAADRLVTSGGERYGSVTKIAKSTDADGKTVLVASSGTISIGQRFLEWAKTGMPKGEPAPSMKDDDSIAYGFVFYNDGRLVSYDPKQPPMTSEMMRSGVFWVAAFGSGGPFALGAMAAGAGAGLAVEIATEFDTHSGAGVSIVAFSAADP